VKTIVATLLALLIGCSSFAFNRIATAADKALYGDYITPGDLIIDTPTRFFGDDREVVYYFMTKQWPGIREGATIWFDGAKLGFLREIKFCNSAIPLNPWNIESARFKNIPDTQVKAGSFFCQGLKYFELDGQSKTFPGLSEWPASRKFLTGSFGFHIIHKMFGGHSYDIAVRDGGTIKIRGVEAQHGFTGIRINGGDYDMVVESIDISNFYIHDTGDGEGQYLGATHKPPLAKLKNLKIYNGIITRTAAEGLQVQHLIGGADVHNITIRSADVRWVNAFMQGQDTGIQWSVDAGENKLHHIIVDGFASVGLIPFGSDQHPIGGISKVSNILFNDGIDTGIYLHNSRNFGVHWLFDSIYYRGFNNSYYKTTGRKERHFIISSKHGTDRCTFKRIYYDGSKKNLFEDTASLEIGKIIKQDLPRPQYQNSGFHELASKIKQWHPYYGGYFPSAKSGSIKIPTQWNTGDIAIETEGEYSFYKCIRSHQATDLRPGSNPNFVRLTWDANGVRSDQSDWQSSAMQSNWPPDDLRLKDGDHWKRLGLGFPGSVVTY
jgi:hypothetical protein